MKARMEAGAIASQSAVRARAGARAARTVAPFLGAIVAASFVARLVAAWLRQTPVYFPDEYLYAALGRSLATSGRPLVRGEGVHFPALLEPLLTAPAWLAGDVETAFRIAQLLGVLAMSLAAVPAYLLATRVGLGRWISLGVASLAVAAPGLLYSGWLLAEPFAYPLVLGAAYLAVSALERPRLATQLGFAALTGLAIFARVQFVVVPICFAAAVVLVGLRERRVRAAIREQVLPLGLFAAAAAGALALGPSNLLGLYRSVLSPDVDVGRMLTWAGNDAFLLVYSSGWLLVPGACLGLLLAIRGPRSRAELALGVFGFVFAAALLLEAVLFGDVDRVQERYFFYLVPLLAILFALYARRGFPLRLPHALIALTLGVVALVVPLAGLAAGFGATQSPFLRSLLQLEDVVGGVDRGALLVALVAIALSGVAIVLSFLPRTGVAAALALGAALVVCVGASLGSSIFGARATEQVRSTLPSDVSWIDHARLGAVTLVQNPGGDAGSAFARLFWNRSLDRVLLLGGATPFDGFGARAVTVDGGGYLYSRGETVRGPLLVDRYAAVVRLHNARLVGADRQYALWATRGAPRLALYALGRYFDGWLAPGGFVRIWPSASGGRVSGWLEVEVATPHPFQRGTLTFTRELGEKTVVPLVPGERRIVRVRVCSQGPWKADFESTSRGWVGQRPVGPRATAPVFRPDPAACPTVPQPTPLSEERA
jgi:hypothetical protein